MQGMFNPNQTLPPEVLEAMLNLSTADLDKEGLDRQRALGEMLTKGAFTYRPMGGGSNVGGAAGALAQGMQGYMAGKQLSEGNAKLAEMGTNQRKQRKSFMDWLYQGSENYGTDGMPIHE